MQVTDLLYKGFEKKADNFRAAQMSRYMKNRFHFYGIQAKDRKAIFSIWYRDNRNELITELVPVILDLWNHDNREAQYVALDLIGRQLMNSKLDDIKLIHYLITANSWWDTVDALATKLLGKYLRIHPDKFENIKVEWSSENNVWLTRSLILFQLKYKEKTDWPLLQDLIMESSASKEFFIRKAQGWALREYSKVKPEVVIKFVEHNGMYLSGLTIREGLKWVSKL